MNGLTQAKIALIVSSVLFFFQLISLVLFYYLVEPFPVLLLILPFVSLLLVYGLTLGLIELFILRKIKILYRTVSQVGRRNPPRDLSDPNLFEKLRHEMEQYSIEKSKELASLKEHEAYRKEFLGNVSHELKTPLFSIQGYIDILLDGGLYDDQINHKYLERIATNTNRLIDIVEDLLLISQVETDQLKLNISKFSLYELFVEVIDSLEVLAKQKNTEVLILDPLHIHYTVKGDRQKLFQVIHNLIENAIYYTPSGTSVKIRFFDMDLDVLIEISDNGEGIEEQHLARLFERFYRVDTDRSRQKGGSGLGLSIVKKILEAHNQTIKVQSKIGKGTTFSFTLAKA